LRKNDGFNGLIGLEYAPKTSCLFTFDKMSVAKYLFPQHNRRFQGMRWVSIGLRTLHLIGIAGIGGTLLQHTPTSIPTLVFMPYLWLTIFSGASMMLLEIWCNGIFLIQLRGIAMLIKILLLASIFYLDEGAYMMIAVIVISGIISHAPGDIRYFRLFKRFPSTTESLS